MVTNLHRQPNFFYRGLSGILLVLLVTACSHAPKQFITPRQKIAVKHEQLGNQYYDRGRSKDAIREWQAALDLAPDRKSLQKRIQAVESGKHWDSQVDSVENNSKGKQEKINSELKKAESYYRNSRLKDAEVTWRHVLSLDPVNQGARQGMARLEDETYRKDLERSFDLMTEDLYEQGMHHFRKEDWESAFTKLSEAGNLNADQPQVKKYLERTHQEVQRVLNVQTVGQLVRDAKAAEEKKSWLAANRLWGKVVALDSSHTAALAGVKRSQMQLEKWSEQEIRKAKKAYKSGKYTSALAAYQRVLGVFSKHLRARQGKKQALAARQQGTQAATQKTQAEKKFNQGVVHYRQGRLDQAITLWEQAVAQDPNDKEYQEWFIRAKKEKAGAVEQNKQQAQITYQDGLAAYQRGELNKAFILWEETLELDPDHQKARANIEKIKKEMD